MTRVLILSWEYPPLIEGGLARHVRKLSESLVELGVDVHVLTRGGEESPADEEVAGVSIHRVREPTRPTDLGEFVAWVERMNSDMLAAGVELGDRYEFDLVHGHDWLVAMACDHLARRFGAPLVTTIHATEYGRHQGWVDKHPQSHIHGVERWITNRADRVIACSYYMREQIADIFAVPDEKVTVIPNGIDPDDLQPSDAGELERLRLQFAPPDHRLVLLIGRLVYEKGFQLALEAMPALIERLPRTRFLVAGSGTHEQELRRQAEQLGLMGHGTFLGWIGDDVLHSLYRIADVCVVPSIYEPFGLVALEAMASGCPCIVADTGGLREVVPHEEAGLRFRARDPEALVEVAARVLSDDELGRRLVAEAYEHLRRFDWFDVAERTSALYAELARERVLTSGYSGGSLASGSTGSAQRSSLGASRIRSTLAGTPPDHRVRGHVRGDHGVGADDGVVAHPDAPQDARSVADPDVGAHVHVALVDALLADRPLDLDHAVVEVDEHRAVGDHALLADPHVLVGGDRALLAEHGLVADDDLALVAADLGAVADPHEAAEPHPAALADLDLEPPAQEQQPVGLPAPARAGEQAPSRVAHGQPRVAEREHAVARQEADQPDHGAGP